MMPPPTSRPALRIWYTVALLWALVLLAVEVYVLARL